MSRSVPPRSDDTSIPDDIRPVVAGPVRQVPAWLIVGLVILSAIALFLVLDGRRRASQAPTVIAASTDTVQTIRALPPLDLRAEAAPPPPPPPPTLQNTSGLQPSPQTETASMIPDPIMPPPYAPQSPPPGYYQEPSYGPPPGYAPAISPPDQMTSGTPANTSSGSATLVIDTMRGPPRPDENQPANGGEGSNTPTSGAQTSIRSSRLGRGTMTVAQGAIIPAVLETALDSTRPGYARAVVSRDITGFDGTRILIPRGSRLFGTYQSDLAVGQARALVQWERLVRPDGVTMALASPAADLQGRTGIAGRVDNHRLERLGSALLQTTLNIGTGLATRSIGGDASAVIVALPGSGQNPGTTTAGSSRLQPTVRVEAGTRVSVLVARDLEFPSGTARP